MAIIDKPSDYFNSVLYTGDGGTNNITGVGFQPDWTWIKSRSNTKDNALFDSVRGVTKRLITNTDTLEATVATSLTAFGSDGFSLGADTTQNANGNTFVAWNWKAGTSVSGNTSGSGTAKAYSGSVNTDSGFSIIKYGGNKTAGHTIPHHLGVAPKMVICKSITQNRGFPIQHASLTSAAYSVFLSTQGAQSNGNNSWNSTAASSSVVTLGDDDNNNRVDSNDQYIMYSFAEKNNFSKFGTYTGNGNADGIFVYLGFKPAFLIVKPIDATDNWVTFDNKRLTFNSSTSPFNFAGPNNSNVETTDTGQLDFVSNGFKIRNSGGTVNKTSAYIYMAFAENPFVTSTGNGSIPATAR
mgnify:CR=1 FL=1